MSTPKKKICFLAATPLTIHFFLKPHIVALASEFDVTLIVNLKNDAYLPPLDLPIKIIHLPIARKMSPIADLWALGVLLRLFMQTRYDLIITVVPKAGLLGMLAAAITRIPKRLHIFQGEVWANRRGFGRLLLKTCDQITAFLASNILAVSNSEKVFLEKQGVAKPGKIQVLSKGSIGGVSLKRFTANSSAKLAMRQQLAIPKESTVILFMGRLVADKGVHELAQAFKLALKGNPNLWLLLVGPDEEGRWQHLFDALGSAVNQVHHQPYTNQPEQFLSAADILCLPSHREGFGVVIIEAAAMGIPSIGSNIYGISDAIIDRKTGFLFERGNVQQLQLCIKTLSINKQMRLELGNNARKYVEQYFSDEQVVGAYIQYVKNVLHLKR
jgi:glycosyltransferase involved in cell wall biosynthesis